MKSNNKFQYIFALLFPFWAMIASIKYFKSPSAKNLFWYGCTFMGYVFIFNPIGGSGADCTRIAANLIEMHNNPVNFETVSGYFYNEENSLDIYQTLVTFLLSFFTGNSHYLFLIFAIIFGYFYSRNIWMTLNYSKTDNHLWYIWIAIIMFLLICPIWEINGGRMWVALQVFMYGLFSFYLKNDKKKIIWCFLSVLFHFSFLFPLTIFILFQFLPKKNLTLYFVFYFVAITFTEINIQSFKDTLIEVLPTQLSSKADSYMNEDSVQAVNERNASYSLYLKIASKMSRYFMLILIAFFWINLKKIFLIQTHRKLLCLFLFFAAIFEVLTVIPSMGRFLVITNLIFYSLLLLLLVDDTISNGALQTTTKYISFLLILPILLSIRIGFEYYGVSLIYSNFIGSFYFEDRQPMIDLVKSFF